MKTKIIPILLIATLLLSSVPFALAEKNNQIGEPKLVDKAPLLRKAAPTIKEYQTSKETYQKIKERYDQKKEAYQEKKQELEQIRQRLKEANPEQKEALRTQVQQKAIENIVVYIEKTVSRLEAFKEKGAESEKIDILIEDLKEYLTELEDAENVTKERIVEIAKDVRSKAKYLHYKGKQVVLKALNNKLSAYAEKTENAYERLSEVIGELKNEGKDVTRLEIALEKLKNDLDEIKDALTKIQEELGDSENKPIKQARIENAAKAVHNRLKADISLVRKMIRHYKGLKQGQQITEDLTVETNDNLEMTIDELGETTTEEIIEEPEEVAEIEDAEEQ